eukprot:TRINITY_DN29032_c0_g1_i1.p1 TRINITY_DN29032_c0_g1~~TRINITY_DN29032_c0_g1_i1.p1  ORF type:complete len:1061 (+),score=199.12 TRINITY_DN29032_c0_g1_i1:52-3234(+)
MRATLPLPASRARAHQQQGFTSFSQASLHGGITGVRSSAARIPVQGVRTAVQQAATAPRASQAVSPPQTGQASSSSRPLQPTVQPTSSWPRLPTLEGLASGGGGTGLVYADQRQQQPLGYAAVPPPVTPIAGLSTSVSASLSAPPASSSPRPASAHLPPGSSSCPPGVSSMASPATASYPTAAAVSVMPNGCLAWPPAAHPQNGQAALPSPLQQQHEWRWDLSPAPAGNGDVLSEPINVARQSSAPDIGSPKAAEEACGLAGQEPCELVHEDSPQRGGQFATPRVNGAPSPLQAVQNASGGLQPQQLQKQSQALGRSRLVDSPRRRNWQQQLPRSLGASKTMCSRKEIPGRTSAGLSRNATSPRGSRQAPNPATNGAAKAGTAASAGSCQQPASTPPARGAAQGPPSWATEEWANQGGARSPRDDRSNSCVVTGRCSSVEAQESARDTISQLADAAGLSAAATLQQVKQELEQLRCENSRLQDKLGKARGLNLQAQRQTEEARMERDRERLRAESLQKSSQQLLRQLKRETAKVQALERQLASTRGRSLSGGPGMMASTGAAPATPPRDAEVMAAEGAAAALRGGSSSSSCIDLASPLQGAGTDGGLFQSEGGDALLDSTNGLGIELESGGEGEGRTSCGAPRRSSEAENVSWQLGDSAPVSPTSQKGGEGESQIELDSPMAEACHSQGFGAMTPLNAAGKLPDNESNGMDLSSPGVESQRSWEFVVQGQHDPEQQQDFAPKIVSCFPDDAVQKALKRGVACVCSRGRRLDRSVPNQDDFVAARHTLVHGGHIALYGVFDGHGPAGHECAAFARGAIPESLFGQRTLLLRPEDTLREAFRQTQANLLRQSFDTTHSGTTAALALVLNLPAPQSDQVSAQGGEAWLFVAHVGDSRAILASHRGGDASAFTVTSLTKDHRPDDAEEAERVRTHGGEIRKLRENSGAARVFARGQDRPALALTRTLGASAAIECGVTAEPDVSAYRLRPGVDVLLVLGTDGLFEFCSNTTAAGQILKEGVTESTLSSLCRQSRRQWAASSYNETVDDITAIAAVLPPGNVNES